MQKMGVLGDDGEARCELSGEGRRDGCASERTLNVLRR